MVYLILRLLMPPVMSPVKKLEYIKANYEKRGKDTPKLTWRRAVQEDLKALHLSEEVAQNHLEWREKNP